MKNEQNDPVRDAWHTLVGLGILGAQQLQVQRRDLQKQLREVATVVEARVDPVLDGLERDLEAPARDVLRQARSAARTLRRALLGTSSGTTDSAQGPVDAGMGGR